MSLAMNPIDEELDELIDGLISTEALAVESMLPPSSLYKYYPPARLADFCRTKSVRFTQPSNLNDPFEFSKRWETQLSTEFINRFTSYIETHIRRMLSNDAVLIDQLIASSQEFPNTSAVRATLKHLLKTPEGKKIKANSLATIPSHMLILSATFKKFSQSNNMLERIRTQTGVFSMSEASDNEQLWALYASEGAGFVLEFNTQSKFFISETGNNLIKQVSYTDQNIPSLFENPYYLFLAKKERWAFEREWRALKELHTASSVVDDHIYLWRLPLGAVKSIILGYKTHEDEYMPHIQELKDFEPALRVQKVELDYYTNALKIIDLNI